MASSSECVAIGECGKFFEEVGSLPFWNNNFGVLFYVQS